MFLRVAQDGASPLGQLSSDGGHHDSPSDPLHDWGPDVLLQFPDLGTDGRLRHEAGRRGPANVPVGVQRGEVLELAHGRAGPRWGDAVITPETRATFEADGVVKVPGAAADFGMANA